MFANFQDSWVFSLPNAMIDIKNIDAENIK